MGFFICLGVSLILLGITSFLHLPLQVRFLGDEIHVSHHSFSTKRDPPVHTEGNVEELYCWTQPHKCSSLQIQQRNNHLLLAPGSNPTNFWTTFRLTRAHRGRKKHGSFLSLKFQLIQQYYLVLSSTFSNKKLSLLTSIQYQYASCECDSIEHMLAKLD